jgi:hypothetical protein
MPRPRKSRMPGRPPKQKKRRPKPRGRRVLDLVTGLYVISYPTPTGDRLMNREDVFVADLNEVRTFKSAVLARIELKHMIESLESQLEEGPEEMEGLVIREQLAILKHANVEAFKTFAAMHYSFDEKGNLTAKLVPWNEGKKLKDAKKEALHGPIQLVKMAEEDLRSFHRRNKPEEKKLTKTLTEAQSDLEAFERKLRAYGKD